MLCGGHLGEGFRLGTVGFVAAGADEGGVELGRFHGRGIVSMPGLGSVAGFARDNHMLALLLLIDDVGMAGLARVVPSEGQGAARCLGDGGAAIVPVLPEGAGDDGGAQDDEGNDCDCHHSGETDEVFNVFEQS